MSSTPRPDRPQPGQPEAGGAANALVFDDPLSRPSADDTDEGWGDRPGDGGSGGAGDLARFLEEKPPHHI